MKDCPTGKLSRNEFIRIYIQFFPHGNPTDFARFVFKTFDKDNDGTICFAEFIRAVSITSHGSLGTSIVYHLILVVLEQYLSFRLDSTNSQKSEKNWKPIFQDNKIEARNCGKNNLLQHDSSSSKFLPQEALSIAFQALISLSRKTFLNFPLFQEFILQPGHIKNRQ